MKRKKGFDKSILLLIFIFLIIAGAAVFFVFRFRTDRITEAIQEEEPFSLAFLVTEAEELLFTEVFMYHPATERGAVLDVPGNTGIIIDSLKKIDRIDVLFTEERTESYISRIETLIDQPIPYFIRIDIDDLISFIDLVEGIEMFIANPVEEVSEESMVLLPSGSVRLDGAKVKTFLTFRQEDAEGEFEKTNRQLKFMQSFLKQIGTKSEELLHDNVFELVRSFIQTNLEKNALQAYIREMENLDVELLVFQRVLGIERGVDQKVLLFPHYDGKLLKETVKQTKESLATSKVTANPGGTVRLEILNGTKRNGLASRTAELFKSYGFEVIKVGNAENFDYEKTVVIGRSDDINKAQEVAGLIDCKKIRTEQKPIMESDEDFNSDFVDVTLILGSDFDGRYCKD